MNKGLSLRQLAVQADIDHSRLARIEQGTRPSPGLATSRTLAELLGLDLATLLVSAGTPREVIDGIVWSDRQDLGARHPEIATYDPRDSDLLRKNTFDVRVVTRADSRCTVRLGANTFPVFSFSGEDRLRIVIPPEAVVVFREDPRPALGHSEGVLAMTIVKVRQLGGATNLVLEQGGIEINALLSREAAASAGHRIGDRALVMIPPAAVRTFPMEACE